MARLELAALRSDGPLLRALARRLAENDAGAQSLRALVQQNVDSGGPAAGGIVAALRRSPLVGADLALDRPHETERDISF